MIQPAMFSCVTVQSEAGYEPQESPVLEAALLAYKRFLSPLIHGFSRILGPVPGGCRFVPTCSEYAYGAVHTHGALRGGALALWRLLRCNPFGHGGLDPVPPPRRSKPRGD